MKNPICLLTLFLVLLFTTVVSCSNSDEPSDATALVDGIKYIVSEGESEAIVVASQYSGKVNVPAQITVNGKSYKVISIGNAFAGTNVVEVSLPNTITGIPQEAFSGCIDLKSVNLPTTLTGIGKWAFAGSGIESIILPPSLTDLHDYAFLDCSYLKDVVIQDSKVALQTHKSSFDLLIFHGCPIEKIYVGRNIQGIELFLGYHSELIIGKDVTNMYNILPTSLTSNSIPKSITFTSTEPPMYNIAVPDVRKEMQQNTVLYVPKEALDIYKSNDSWKDFEHIEPLN